MKYYLVESPTASKRIDKTQRLTNGMSQDEIRRVDDIENADVVVPIGGDGAMLYSIKTYRHYGKPFIGINTGTRGFLMNALDESENIVSLLKAEIEYQSLWLVEVDITFCNDKIERHYGFNDVWIERASGQTLRMHLSIDGMSQSTMIVGDGMLFSTPQGSSGYNLALRGKIIAPGVPVLQVTPMACIVNKAALESIILSDQSKVRVDFEQIEKRPAGFFVDGVAFKSDLIKSVDAKRSAQTVKLGFSKHSGFLSKVTSWQTRL
ncbi:MAG: NAD(+)/NADH kinase [Gammaproteobacteria bacterium]|nr:NAD(+)/NADH kinase [Gammaproteobacteria bacterium]